MTKRTSAIRKFLTLVELLVYASLLSVVLSLYISSVQEWFGYWEQAEAKLTTRIQLRRVHQQIGRDLRCTVKGEKAFFAGDTNAARFTCWQDADKESTLTRYRIEWDMVPADDPARQGLRRRLINENGETESEKIYDHVSQIHFEYAETATEGAAYDWQSTWNARQARLPLAVKIRLISARKSDMKNLENLSALFQIPGSSRPSP